MAVTGIEAFDRTVHKTNIWLAHLDEELGGQGREQALRVLRAFLHALRDRLTVDVAADFAAQLPTLLRGVFYENYQPARAPARYGRDGFLARLVDEAGLVGPTEAAVATEAVVRVLTARLAPGALPDAVRALPGDLQVLLTG